MNTAWLTYSEQLSIELLQSRDEGKDVSGYEKKVEEILKLQGAEREKRAAALMDELAALPVQAGYPYREPSDLEGIQRETGERFARRRVELPEEALYDKILGAWLGRCAGCLLGQPIEGWKRARILGLLKETDNYPFRYYISSDVSAEIRERYDIQDKAWVYGSSKKSWINNVEHMVEDDDTNYTIIALSLLERFGLDFTPENVAETWLMNLPILHVCTAERVAYKNLVNLIPPPGSAVYRNAYREWIGAQIRGDFFGYITPGNPALGAEMAWRDASISHVKNGIYGEMWVAAMLSAAAVVDDMEDVIRIGLGEIPQKSRLAEALRDVLTWKKSGMDWEKALDEIHRRYDENNGHDWCHTISNAVIVAAALLYGEKDFEKSISMAVLAAFDTDCNGATVGSILGMVLGAKNLPNKWIAPLNNLIKSGVDGFQLVKISELAERTLPFAKMTMGL